MPIFSSLFIALNLLITLFAQISFADNTTEPPAGQSSGEKSLPVLPQVTVTGYLSDKLSSSTTIDQEMIDKLPRGKGNITERLQSVPGVQLSESFNNSKQGGEIRPPEISISGSRAHENNYLIDGISINSLLDPTFDNINNVDNIPGHSQELFIPDHLIKDVTVYRSNIPARYGSFTGGVVIANTVEPEPEFTGELAYRTTRSEWTQFHIDSSEEEEFKNSIDSSNQPDFDIHESNATFHIPVNPVSGLYFNYSRKDSTIPLQLIDKMKKERRQIESYFLKYQAEPNNSTKVTFQSNYTPYEGEHFLKNTLNSDYTLEEGGYRFNGKLEKETLLGQVEVKLAWQQSENSRQAPRDWKNWQVSDSKNWGGLIGNNFSPEGGYGDVEKLQKSFSGKINVDFTEIAAGVATHSFNAGVDFERAEATFDRTETTTRYIAAKTNSAVDCNGENSDCIDGEQFFWFKNVYPEDKARAEISNYHAYIDDSISISRLTLRPGLRVTYNDYQKNTDYASRFAASFDLFGNGKTLLTGGRNKYYGKELLTHNLSSQKTPFQVWRRSTVLDASNQPQPWAESPRSSINVTQVSDLKTPYSNEITIGLIQELFGGDLELLYIDREYKNQIVTIDLGKDPDGFVIQEFRNEGRRLHEEFSVSWERSWVKHYLFMEFTWQDTKSNSADYRDTFDPDETDLLVWYDGKPIRLSKLETSDFNRPRKASLIYSVELPKGFTFTNETRYRSRYQAVKLTNKTPPPPYDGLEYYEKVSRPSAFIFDWKIKWETPEWRGNSLELSLDVLNVFNRKIAVGNVEDAYLLGRRYWAEVAYKF